MTDRIRYVVALVVGLLAIPGLALATNSALSSDEPQDSAEVLGIAATSTTAISAEDLVRACGVEGRYLVDLEGAAAIDDIQQAALNALRPICDDAGLPLPAAPIVEGETIVETVTVVRAVPGSAPTPSTTSPTTSTSLAEAVDADNDASEVLAVRARALAAIDTAIAFGGNVEKINEAIALIGRGDTAYGSGDYDQANELFQAAEHRATEAQHELQVHEDDGHEDDEHEDDEHEDDD